MCVITPKFKTPWVYIRSVRYKGTTERRSVVSCPNSYENESCTIVLCNSGIFIQFIWIGEVQ